MNLIPAMQISADSIKSFRLALGETQSEFGERFGVDQATVSNWENRGPPKTGAGKTLIERVFREVVMNGKDTRP